MRSFLAVLNGRALRTGGGPVITNLSSCCKKFLALAFGIGAVSGIATAFVVGAAGTPHLLTDRATARLPI